MDGRRRIQVIVLSAVAVAAALLVFSMYGVSRGQSRRAEELSGGATLCRRIAEVCLKEDDWLAAFKARGWEADSYGDSYGLQIDGFKVKIQMQTEKKSAGALQTIKITLYNAEEEEIYSLDTAKYRPDGAG